MDDRELFLDLATADDKLTAARARFLQEARNKEAVLRQALREPSERGPALRLLPYVDGHVRQALLPTLIGLAVHDHRDLFAVREAILTLDRSWLVENIERTAAGLLPEFGDMEYRRLLELYDDLDDGLTQRLALKALASGDPDIREVGEEFADDPERAGTPAVQ